MSNLFLIRQRKDGIKYAFEIFRSYGLHVRSARGHFELMPGFGEVGASFRSLSAARDRGQTLGGALL